MDDKEQGIVIDETPATEGEAKIDLSGASPQELELAKKHGIEEKNEAPVSDVPAQNSSEKTPEEPAVTEKELREAARQDLSPEQENKILTKLDKISQAYYWEKKAERKKRQQAEIDRDYALTQKKALEERLKLAEERLALKNQKDDDGGIFDDKPSDTTADDDKPITKKDIAELEAKKNAEEEAKREEGRKLAARLEELEAQGRASYEDFDKTVELATDIVKNAQTLFGGDKKRIAKAQHLYDTWRNAASNALNDTGEYSAADIAYELGQMHPEYGKKKEEPAAMPEVKQPSRVSSAALAGGGRKMVPYSEITMEQAARLTPEQYAKLPREVRERLLKT